MKCDDIQELISPYVDGELGLLTAVEVERHLHECALCSQEVESHRALHSALRTDDLYFKLPPQFEKQVRTVVRQAQKAETAPRRFSWLRLGMAAAAALLFTAILITFIVARSEKDRLVQEVIASHVRSLMVSHLTDVPSSDQHTVKPWFNGKLDFSPSVKDLAADGFSLVGGRLDYLDQHPVAALVYQRRQHYINVFVWPLSAERGSPHGEWSRQGYNVMHWSDGEMSYWAVSDLNSGELNRFVTLLKQ